MKMTKIFILEKEQIISRKIKVKLDKIDLIFT